MTGEVPQELANLKSLETIQLGSNDFTGCLPALWEDQLFVQYSDLGGLDFC